MTLDLHITAIVLAVTAAAAALVAAWAATSLWHWFWRALAIWACIAALLPIRAYEPAVVFAISLPIATLAIRRLVGLKQGWQAISRVLRQKSLIPRFKLIDLLLAMTLLGLALAT